MTKTNRYWIVFSFLTCLFGASSSFAQSQYSCPTGYSKVCNPHWGCDCVRNTPPPPPPGTTQEIQNMDEVMGGQSDKLTRIIFPDEGKEMLAHCCHGGCCDPRDPTCCDTE